MVIADREVVTLSDRPGAFVVIRRGRENTRVAPTKTPDKSFTVPNTLLEEMKVGAPDDNGTSDENFNDTFETLEELTECVAKKFSNGIFITGPGGTGKTFTVMKVLERLGMKEGTDFIVIKGYSTAAAMYNSLAEHKTKLVIFDDCDSVLSDDTGLNILKAVLDTYPTRRVSWNTNSPLIKEPVFDFTGQIIFISNLAPKRANQHFQALRTRVLTVNIAGSPLQMKDRCIELMPEIGKDLTPQARQELCDFIQQNFQRINHLSLRYAVNLVSIRKFKPVGWQDLALKLH